MRRQVLSGSAAAVLAQRRRHCMGEIWRRSNIFQNAIRAGMELSLQGGAITSVTCVALTRILSRFKSVGLSDAAAVFGKAIHCLARAGEEIAIDATATQAQTFLVALRLSAVDVAADGELVAVGVRVLHVRRRVLRHVQRARTHTQPGRARRLVPRAGQSALNALCEVRLIALSPR